MSIARGLSIVSLCAVLLVSAAQAAKKPPANWDGLELRKVKGLDLVYVRPNVEFTPYKSVQLDDAEVEFQKNWEKSQDFSRRPTADDMQRIKDKLAELMREGFTEELTKHGYSLVDTPNDDTLHVRTAIIDLFINAPDLRSEPGNVRSYTTSAGSMTMVLEARDGPSGQLLARVIDGRSDSGMNQMMWTNSVTNVADAKRIIDVWARRLRESLDRLNGKEK